MDKSVKRPKICKSHMTTKWRKLSLSPQLIIHNAAILSNASDYGVHTFIPLSSGYYYKWSLYMHWHQLCYLSHLQCNKCKPFISLDTKADISPIKLLKNALGAHWNYWAMQQNGWWLSLSTIVNRRQSDPINHQMSANMGWGQARF